MSKNKKLEERTRAFFIKAAMDILKSEGIKCISARNIAEAAGYSYATLYNYFKDMNTLIFECLGEFRTEIFDFVGSALSAGNDESAPARIKRKLKALAMYFIQYPGIFDLFFLEKMTTAGRNNKSADTIIALIPDLLNEELKSYSLEMGLVESEEKLLVDHLLFTVSGLLLFFMNRSYPGDYNEMLEKLDQQINLMFVDRDQAV